MTPSTMETTTLADATQRVVEAADHFPGDGLVAGPADSQTDLTELLTGDDAFVAVVPLDTSVPQELVFVASPALLSGFGVTSPEALPGVLGVVIDELADGATVLSDRIRVATGLAGLDGVAVSGRSPGQELVAAGLFLGADHVATLGIAIGRAESPSAGPATDHDPEPEGPATPLPDAAPNAAPEDVGSPLDLPEVRSSAPTADAHPGAPAVAGGGRSLSLLRNVEMSVTAELGRTRMTVAELLSLTPGSVVELDKAAGTPIDLLVNGTLIARGEVVVIDEEFGVRISEIVDRVDGV
jgi:flagellar motor switch protein FliN